MAVTEHAAKYSADINSGQLVLGGNHNAIGYDHQVINPSPIDFDECLKDSPRFRHTLKENLASTEHLESFMSKTIKHISNYIDTGRDHIKSQRDFINSMRSLSNALGSSHKETVKNVGNLLETLEEISRLHEIVIDQSARTVGNSLRKFINDDLLKIREARKSFDKISHEYDQALLKYSQPVKKQQEDSENLLIATSTAFTHTSLDLSIQLTSLQSKKGCEILSSLLSLTRAHGIFFHQGYDLFEDFKPHISDMDKHLSKIQDEFETLTRNLPSKHLMVSNNELKPLCFDNRTDQVHLEGYLFKRASNGFKIWNRRWFILKDHQLIYMKRGDPQPIVMEEDLRLLTVRQVDKTDSDRRFCFEIVSPQKSHILQADSESACKTWIRAIQAGINAAFHDTESDKPERDCTDLSISAANNSQMMLKQNGNSSVSTSSWSSGFSLKALQQQATSKFSSLTGGDSKDLSVRALSKDKPSVTNQCRKQAELDEGDESDSFNELLVDEHGRSYALLRHEDEEEREDEEDKGTSNKVSSNHDVVKYPMPANIPDETDQTSATSCITKNPTTNADPPEKPQRAYMFILGMPGNDVCADCGAAQPRWASINLGITLCIECAGIHRSLGVHLSKVRSLTLDTEVWSPEIVQLMLSLGNSSVNSAYLACYRGQIPAINNESGREEREEWIKTKYLRKSFMRPPDAELDDSTASEQANATDQENELQTGAETTETPLDPSDGLT